MGKYRLSAFSMVGVPSFSRVGPGMPYAGKAGSAAPVALDKGAFGRALIESRRVWKRGSQRSPFSGGNSLSPG